MWTAPVRAPSGSRLTLAFDGQVERKGVSRMSEDDVLFGYRLRVFDHAARTSVSEACRVFGIHRSTYYGWKRRIERHGLEILRPRERRRPRQPKQLSPLVEERIVAFALGHPGLGPKRSPPSWARSAVVTGSDPFGLGGAARHASPTSPAWAAPERN